MSDFHAVNGPDGIESLQLGPVAVTWSRFDDRVCVRIKSNYREIEVYSSATGRSLRAFGDGGELK